MKTALGKKVDKLQDALGELFFDIELVEANMKEEASALAALKGCDFVVDASKMGSIKATSSASGNVSDALAEQAANEFVSALSEAEKFELQCFDPAAALSSEGVSSSGNITKKFLLGQMQDLP